MIEQSLKERSSAVNQKDRDWRCNDCDDEAEFDDSQNNQVLVVCARTERQNAPNDCVQRHQLERTEKINKPTISCALFCLDDN